MAFAKPWFVYVCFPAFSTTIPTSKNAYSIWLESCNLVTYTVRFQMKPTTSFCVNIARFSLLLVAAAGHKLAPPIGSEIEVESTSSYALCVMR
jgi:hypothetical protein